MVRSGMEIGIVEKTLLSFENVSWITYLINLASPIFGMIGGPLSSSRFPAGQ